MKIVNFLWIMMVTFGLSGYSAWVRAVREQGGAPASLGGEPMASAGADMRVLSAVKKPDETAIKVQAASPTEPAIKVQAASATDASISDATPPAPGTRMVTIIDGTSGRRQNVVVPEFDAKNAEDRMTERSRLGLVSKTGPEAPRIAKPTPAKQTIP